jgi:hypothetical protein
VRHICVTLQDVYTQASAAGAPLVQWLPRWHRGLLQVVEAERDWLALQLPEQQPALFLQVRATVQHCVSQSICVSSLHACKLCDVAGRLAVQPQPGTRLPRRISVCRRASLWGVQCSCITNFGPACLLAPGRLQSL